MTNQVDIVIEMARKVIIDALRRLPRVADELTLGHLVADVWGGEVH